MNIESNLENELDIEIDSDSKDIWVDIFFKVSEKFFRLRLF